MGRHPQREGLVKELRSAASKCGAARVPQMAARPRVTEMMEAIRSSGGPEGVKAEAERLFATYEATFAADSFAPAEESEGGEAGEGDEEVLQDLFAAEGEGEGEGHEGDEGEGALFDYSGRFWECGGALNSSP